MITKNSADQFAARLLMVSFFLPAKWQEVAVMSASVWFIYRSVHTKQKIDKLALPWALLLGSITLLHLAAIFITPAAERKFVYILSERKAALLFMPFIFALAGPYYRQLIVGKLRYFVYACLISCLAGNTDFIYHYIFLKKGLHGLSHVDYRVIMERFTGIHPTYLGMFLCFSICVVLLSPLMQWGNRIRYATLYLLLVLLLALLVKAALIALVIICIHYAWQNRNALLRYRLQLAGMLAAIAAACYFIPFVGQRTREVLSYFGMGTPGTTTDNSVYMRGLIMSIDTRLLKHNWLAGLGPGRLLHTLNEHYFFYSLYNNFDIGYYDPHNEYFSEWLSFGIVGIVILLAMLALHFRRAIQGGNHLYLYCLIILSVTFFTETVLSRQDGVLFYALFTSLFFFSKEKKLDTRKHM